MSEDAFYDRVAQELQAQTMVTGLWTRAFAEAGGQLDRARALYIKLRVAQLAQEASEKLRQERRAATEAAKKRAIAKFRMVALALLGVVFGLMAFVLFLIGVSGPFMTPPEPIGEAVFFIIMAAVFGFVTYGCAKASSQ